MTFDWSETLLGDIGEFKNGANFSQEDYGVGYSIINVKQLYSGRFISLTGLESLGKNVLKRPEQLFLEAGDILFARSSVKRSGAGQCALVPEGVVNTIFSGFIIRYRLKDKKSTNPMFLSYLLQSPVYREIFQRIATGTTISNLSQDALKTVQVALPNKPTQDKIAELLGSLDDRITLLRETNSTLEAMAQALFKSWFVDFDPVRAKEEGRQPDGLDEATTALFPDSFERCELGAIPKGWRLVKLNEITERITKGTTPTTLKKSFVEAGINFIKAESMTGSGGFITDKFAFIDNETHELLRRSQLKAGDVLISIAGTIGRIAVMTDDFLPANTNQAVAILRPIVNVFPSELLNLFLRLDSSQQSMNEKVVQAVQANLSLGTLSELKLAIPPQSLIIEILNSGFAQIQSSWTANDQRIRTLSSIRSTLIPRLISGQLRLPDAEEKIEAATA